MLVSMIESSVVQIETKEEEKYWRQLIWDLFTLPWMRILILAPPAGGQVMGSCENNWYPALQIILEPDWINITN